VGEWGRGGDDGFQRGERRGRGVGRGRPSAGAGGRAQARARLDSNGDWEGEEAGAGPTCKRERREGNRGHGGLGR
jgi:hypothetical protein